MAGLGWGSFRVGGGSGVSLTASSATFLTTVSSGALIANLANPFGTGTDYTAVGTVPGQLALSGSTIVAGASAPVAGTNYSIKVRAANAGATRAVEETLTFTARAVTATPTPTPSPTPTVTLRAVGTGGRVATGARTFSTTTKWRNRSTTFVRAATSFVEFRYPNWFVDDSGVTQYVSYPAGTTMKCQFDAYPSGTIVSTSPNRSEGKINNVAGATGATIVGGSDERWIVARVSASDLGLSSIPAGAAICCTLEADTLATGVAFPLTDSTASGSTNTGGEAFYQGGTTSIGTYGALAANGGTAANYALRPFAVLGDAAAPAVIAIGDSNTAGKGAGRPAADGQSALAGMAAYGLWRSGQPYSVFGKNGDRASFWDAAPSGDVRWDTLAWFDAALINLGTNDLAGATSATDTSTSTASIASVRSLRLKIKAKLAGDKRIAQAYILPRVTNASGFTTTAAQTVSMGYKNSDAARPGYDAAMQADVGVNGRALNAAFDPRSLVNDATETDKWKVDGATTHYFESDGTHLSAAGASAASQAYVDAVTALYTVPFTVSNNRMAFVGDSRTFGGVVNGTFDARSHVMWTRQASAGTITATPASAFGTGGYTTAQVRSTHLPSAITSGAGTILWFALGNDPASGTSADQSIAEIKAARDTVVAAGRRFVICTDYAWVSQVNQGWIDTVNTVIRTMATVDGQVMIADVAAALASANDSASLLQPDGVHLSGAGGLLAGRTIWSAIRGGYAAIDPHAASGVINPLEITNTSGGSKGSMAGVVATGFTATGPAAVTASVIQRADGVWGQRFAGTLQPGEVVTFYRDVTGGSPTTYGIASGDTIESMIDYETAETTGDLRLIGLQTRYNGGTVIPQADDGQSGGIAAGTSGYPASGYHFKGFRDGFKGLLRTVAKPLPGTPNRIGPLASIQARTNPTDAGTGALVPAAAVTIDVTFFRMEARKIV